MAFTASGSNPITYQGTDQADQGIFTTSNFIALGEAGNDLFNLGTVAQATVLGGQGNDLVTQNILGSSSLQAGYINGNLGDDTLGQLQIGVSGTISAFLGGQGNDTIFVGNVQSSQVNGNIGNDVLNIGGLGTTGTVNTANSSIWGGQGDDVLNIGNGQTNTFLSTVFGGNLGNDSLAINLSAASVLTGTTFEGGDGNDTINGTGSNAGLVIIGDGAADDGADFLTGGNGSDTISGGALNDVLNGGTGADFLSGGTGSNRFVFGANAGAAVLSVNGGTFGGLSAGNSANAVLNLGGATDVITDWAAAAAGTNVINSTASNLATAAGAAQNALSNTAGMQTILGTYNATLGTFQMSAVGNDVLVANVALAAAGGSIASINNTVVLQGAGTSTFSQANFI
jgi:hypothetical protein